MPDRLTILLDQNVPQAVVSWLKLLKPTWAVFHTGDVGLSGKSDEEVFAWAQQQGAVVVTFDEDCAPSGLADNDRRNRTGFGSIAQ